MVIPHTDDWNDEALPLTAEDGFSDDVARVRDDRRLSTEDELHDLTLGMSPDMVDELTRGYNDHATVRMRLAQARQERIARANARIEFAASRVMDGMTVQAEVSREVFDYWLSRQEELGANPWDSDEFWEEMVRDNPEVRVRTVNDRTVILSGWESERAGEGVAA